MVPGLRVVYIPSKTVRENQFFVCEWLLIGNSFLVRMGTIPLSTDAVRPRPVQAAIVSVFLYVLLVLCLEGLASLVFSILSGSQDCSGSSSTDVPEL